MREWNYGLGHAVWTSKADGGLGHRPPRGVHDESCCGEAITARRSVIRPGEWLHLTQVHGDAVVTVSHPSAVADVQDTHADAAVTDTAGVNLAIATADCAPIALISDEGLVGAVHAGWKGLQAGVIDRAVLSMRMLGASRIAAALGPCIHVECYEFGEAELATFVQQWGSAVAGETDTGTPAFNLPAAVDAACRAADVELVSVAEACTACSGEYFSYRRHQDEQRQVMVVWTDRD